MISYLKFYAIFFFKIYLYILFSSNFKLKIRERLFPESAKYVDNIYSSWQWILVYFFQLKALTSIKETSPTI